jgi:hypothetical protein
MVQIAQERLIDGVNAMNLTSASRLGRIALE